jgi:uncharacterized protein YqgC (DUF456 family)
MKPTNAIGLAALVVIGIIFADGLAHPAGVKQAGASIVAVATPTYAALLGQVPSGYKAAA